MSTRTIIEINHDYLAFLLEERQQVFPTLLGTLRMGEGPCWVRRHLVSGIRILGQRHHSDPEWAPAIRRPGSFVNGAGILASDKPAQVVAKLDHAFHRASGAGHPGTVTAEQIRAAGGIVDSDGNVCFTTVSMLNKAIELARGEQTVDTTEHKVRRATQVQHSTWKDLV